MAASAMGAALPFVVILLQFGQGFAHRSNVQFSPEGIRPLPQDARCPGNVCPTLAEAGIFKGDRFRYSPAYG